MSEDGSEKSPIAEGQVETASESSVAYTNDDGFVISSLDGSESRVVLKQDDGWRFRLAEFSPDGRWIAFTRFHCGECQIP